MKMLSLFLFIAVLMMVSAVILAPVDEAKQAKAALKEEIARAKVKEAKTQEENLKEANQRVPNAIADSLFIYFKAPWTCLSEDGCKSLVGATWVSAEPGQPPHLIYCVGDRSAGLTITCREGRVP